MKPGFVLFVLVSLGAFVGCALFGPVSVNRRFVDLPPRVEPCVVKFLDHPLAEAEGTLLAQLAIDVSDPAPEHWKDHVRQRVCALGGDTVWVTALVERRDAWVYCGGRDSLCQPRSMTRYLGTALAYRSNPPPPEVSPTAPAAPDAPTAPTATSAVAE
jgi:hypothetical protein